MSFVSQSGSGSVKFDNACDHAAYGTTSPGQSIYLIDLAATDSTQSSNWRSSTLCQGTPVFTSFESNSGDFGSPNDTIGGGDCFPTITTSTPITGAEGVSVDLATIDITFSEPITIMAGIDAVTLVCGTKTIAVETEPALPATSITEIKVKKIDPDVTLSDTGNQTLCTLTFKKELVSNEASSPIPAAFPTDFELAIEFDTVVATLIELASFDANKATNGSVTLSWVTAAEIDNAGFNLYRGSTPSGPWISLNDGLIAAQGSAFGSTAYRFIDDNGAGYYMLEDVDTSGVTTQHGPITIADSVANASQGSYSLFLPMLHR